MSIYRVITRIIPLSSTESAFEPASFDSLVDGDVGEVKVLNLTEPQSGMKYRIERIKYVQNVGAGETIDSVNSAYAEKLGKIPGFVQLKANELPLNPYDKSFQLTLPKVLFAKASSEESREAGGQASSQTKSPDSFKISLVKNFSFNKTTTSQSPKKRTSSKRECDDSQNSDFKSSKGFKTKYPTFLCKKIKNSVWKSKSKSPPSKLSLQSKSHWKVDCNGTSASQSYDCPTSSYVQANKAIDARSALDIRITDRDKSGRPMNDSLEDDSCKKSDVDGDDDKTDISGDSSDDLEYRELIINVPEGADSCPPGDKLPKSSENNTSRKSSINGDLSNGAIEANGEDSVIPKESDSGVCCKYAVLGEHPLYELLMSLKKYFVNGECLICGFIPTDVDFNASEHMESHISSNSFVSCFKCFCCDEKFGNPQVLYRHTLAREKSYRYMCNICLLKFKRKHYLMRHTAKSH